MRDRFDYRSTNGRPTALGIERKLYVFGGMLTLIRFHLGGGFIESPLSFLSIGASGLCSRNGSHGCSRC